MRHSFIPRGSIIILREGTKIIQSNGETHIVPTLYTIELDYDSPETDEYIFWFNYRCKTISILVGTQPR